MQNNSDLFGLVLTGGFSKRMGKEKALLDFHGKPQFIYLFDLLKAICEKVFLSCRAEQSAQFGDQYPMIFDLHDSIGPMNGLLSFFEKYPTKACLVLACDMPFVDEKAIRFLIENRQPGKLATAFKNKKDFPEPLIAIWEPKSLKILKAAFRKNLYSLRDLLRENDCRLLLTIDDKTLLNINQPEDLETVLKALRLPPGKS